MNRDASLLRIAQLILSEEDDSRAPEALLLLAIEAVSAERGFIVVRENASFEQRFAVHFERSLLSDEERGWSRRLVRRAIEERRVIVTWRGCEDPSFNLFESLVESGAAAVLVAPLPAKDEVFGAVYIEWIGRPPDLAGDVAAFFEGFAQLAGLFLKQASERESLRRRNESLERDLFAKYDFQGIVGVHPTMIALLRMVAQVATADATVLIRGETGTGKELIARALHVNSPRRHKPIVTLHTSALPGSILESELFGHVKGAFTGAERDRVGRIASAHGGTLFLDEVAEIAPEVQSKLLRFLQFGEIQRVGSDRTEKVDVRVLAATHQDLPALAETGKFRRDLLYRLKVIELTIPPLRERQSDIAVLVEHFLRSAWKRPGERPRFTARAERALLEHNYPGNVRELAHAVERAAILASGPELDLDLLPPDIAPAPASASPVARRFLRLDAAELNEAREANVAETERAFLAALMERHGGNVSQAARGAGLNRSYLQKLLARHRRGTSS